MSAPSEYVEVVPTAGGGVVEGSGSERFSSEVESGPGSALGAAADAVASADSGGVLALAAAMVAATAWLVATAVRRARASRRLVRPSHDPNG
jgi:hypothetical protein